MVVFSAKGLWSSSVFHNHPHHPSPNKSQRRQNSKLLMLHTSTITNHNNLHSSATASIDTACLVPKSTVIMRCYISLLAFASLLPNGHGFVAPNAGASRQSCLVRLQEQPAGDETPKPVIKPEILSPFPEAADPMYPVRGPVGKGDFTLSREGPVTAEELTNENLYRILLVESSDLEVNTLVWKGLGYRFDPESEEWKNDECFPKWRVKFPTPPDLIGMQRTYSKEIDGPCLKNNQQLVRSIPADNKQSLKVHLKPLGFTGYKVSQRLSWTSFL